MKIFMLNKIDFFGKNQPDFTKLFLQIGVGRAK